MQVVVLAAHGLCGRLRVVYVADEEPRRVSLLEPRHADGTLVAVLDLVAVVVEQLDVEQGGRLAHGTGLRLDPGIGGEKDRAFGLPEALADLLAREALPLDGDLGVQRFAGGGEVLDAREVVARHVFLKHEAVHGGRGAERPEVVVLHVLQKFGGHELVHVIAEDLGAGDPLPVDLAPAELCPAAVGDAHVEAVLLHLLPILRREDVPEGVGEVVHDGLGVARGATGEVDEHDVLRSGGVNAGRACPFLRFVGDELVKREPSLALACDADFVLYAGRLLRRPFGLRADVVVVHAHEHPHVCRVCAVLDIVGRELQRRGDDRGAYLAQCGGHHPILPPATQDAHDHVALADAKLHEGVCGFV